MTFELELANVDSLDDATKTLYVKDGEKFKLHPSVADLQTQHGKMQKKNEELLGETKAAKKARQDAEEAAVTKAAKAAQEAGDFKSLFDSATAKLAASDEKYAKLADTVANEKRTNAAMKMAVELAEGTNAELLAEFISRRLKYTDDGLKVVDGHGALTISSLDDLKKEFQGDAKYAALLKGNQASGGGANGGGKSGGGAAKEISKADFEKKSPQDRASYIKGGGKII